MIVGRKTSRKYELHEFTDGYGQERFYKIRVKDGWFWKWLTKTYPFYTTAVPGSEFAFDTYDRLAHEFRDPEVAIATARAVVGLMEDHRKKRARILLNFETGKL